MGVSGVGPRVGTATEESVPEGRDRGSSRPLRSTV